MKTPTHRRCVESMFLCMFLRFVPGMIDLSQMMRKCPNISHILMSGSGRFGGGSETILKIELVFRKKPISIKPK